MKPREGYLLIDHSASPGVSQELVRSTGFAAPAVSSNQKFESPIIACAHCNTPVILNPNRTRPRGYCRKCDAYVCDNPACNSECTPFTKTLDDLQEAAFRSEAGYRRR
jgi:hypothetical protein